MKREVCELLPWDTDFFGFRIARVRGETLTQRSADEVIEWCRASDIKCLYFLADPESKESVDAATAHSFIHVDDRLTYRAPVNVLASRIDSVVRTGTVADVPRLREIARVSHVDSRFFNDYHFDRIRCGELYEQWIEKSVNGWADIVFVAEVDGELHGYITCSKEASQGSIGLLAVTGSARGRGIGRSLIESAAQWFADERLDEVRVVTQGRNAAARAFYEKAGFQLLEKKIWFHKWFD